MTATHTQAHLNWKIYAAYRQNGTTLKGSHHKDTPTNRVVRYFSLVHGDGHDPAG